MQKTSFTRIISLSDKHEKCDAIWSRAIYHDITVHNDWAPRGLRNKKTCSDY